MTGPPGPQPKPGAGQVQVHGSAVALAGIAVLLRGAPGSGKSDLTLRLIDGGARLVADDRVDLTLSGGIILASAPPALRGLLEIRGLGIVRLEVEAMVPLGLVIDLAPGVAMERIPDPAECRYLGVRLPLLRLDPASASAAAKVRLAARAVTQDIIVPS
jgi:HPr kinase/phosphorylase